MIICPFPLFIIVPDEDRMAKRAGRALGDFKDLVFPEGYVPGAGKRKVGSVQVQDVCSGVLLKHLTN